VLDTALSMICMNFHQLERKTKEIILNRQTDVEKLKKYIPLKSLPLIWCTGARAPYITKSFFLQIQNPNLYSGKVRDRQLAQIIVVYLARKNIAQGVNFTPPCQG